MVPPRPRALLCRLSDGAIMVVPIATEPTFTAGTPNVLFEGRYFDAGGHYYEVAADGQRLLMVKESESTDASALPIILVENWFEELELRFPATRADCALTRLPAISR